MTLTTSNDDYAFTVKGARRTPDIAAVVTPPAVIPHHFLLTAPASAMAGTSFDVTVTAKDATGNTLTGYTGTVQFSTNDTTGTVPGNVAFSALQNGVRTVPGFVLKKSGSQTVSVKDVTTTTATGTAAVTVTPGPPVAIRWTNTACDTGLLSVSPKGSFVSSVTLLDTYGNVATNTLGGAQTVNFTQASGGSTGATVSPATSSIAVNASETSAPVTAQLPNGGNKNVTVNAAVAGQSWGALTCKVSS